MGTPVEVIKAVEKHVMSQHSMGLCSKEESCQAHLQMLLGRLRRMRDVPMSDVTTADEYLAQDQGTFNALQRQQLAEVLQAVMTDGAAPPVKNGMTMQSHKYIHKTIPAKV